MGSARGSAKGSAKGGVEGEHHEHRLHRDPLHLGVHSG